MERFGIDDLPMFTMPVERSSQANGNPIDVASWHEIRIARRQKIPPGAVSAGQPSGSGGFEPPEPIGSLAFKV